MPTFKRILASRANGARSRGPVTPQGKRQSSGNAASHGLLANFIVLKDESRESFEALLKQHIDRLGPSDVEFGMIEEMAAAHWRLRRAWAIEACLIEEQALSGSEASELGRMAGAFRDLSKSGALGLLHRYETRLHCMYQRALHNLLLLRASEAGAGAACQERPDRMLLPAPSPRVEEEDPGAVAGAGPCVPPRGAKRTQEVIEIKQTSPGSSASLDPPEPEPLE